MLRIYTASRTRPFRGLNDFGELHTGLHRRHLPSGWRTGRLLTASTAAFVTNADVDAELAREQPVTCKPRCPRTAARLSSPSNQM